MGQNLEAGRFGLRVSHESASGCHLGLRHLKASLGLGDRSTLNASLLNSLVFTCCFLKIFSLKVKISVKPKNVLKFAENATNSH